VLKPLSISDLDEIVAITSHLNPEAEVDMVKTTHQAMFEYSNYYCFGYYDQEDLIAVCGLWKTIRVYSGLQFEIDHFVVNQNRQSEGMGKQFLLQIENWAKNEGAKTIELNTYTENKASHKFYHREDFKILGFHFQKYL
jgi:GNAT superfamily N-acetyltransferase